jgi:hypothetical protein
MERRPPSAVVDAAGVRAAWPVAAVVVACLCIRPEVNVEARGDDVPADKGAAAVAFDDTRAAAVDGADVVVIGNSMAYSSIDPALLSALSGRRAALVGMANSHAVHWYLALKNVVAARTPPPRTVFVFSQDAQLLEVSARDAALRESLALPHEPALAARAARTCTTPRQRFAAAARAAAVAAVPLVGVQRTSVVSDVVDWLLPAQVWRGRTPFEAHVEWSAIFDLGQLRARPDASEVGDAIDVDDFALRLSCSLVPDMLAVARDAGIQLVFVRVQNRPRPTQGPDQPPEVKAVVDALAGAVAAGGGAFVDFTGDPAVTLDMYSYGSHISDAARPAFTRHFFSTTRALWSP